MRMETSPQKGRVTLKWMIIGPWPWIWLLQRPRRSKTQGRAYLSGLCISFTREVQYSTEPCPARLQKLFEVLKI
ncbi:hypothetical protein BDW62DRAFT_194966 [Aspergillus aurantiobrunneus]